MELHQELDSSDSRGQRIDKLESRLADLETRIQQLETRVLEPTAELRLAHLVPEEHPVVHAGESSRAEYWIGARLVPRLGAVLIILAIAFIAVSESSKSATMDRSVLLIAESLFCFAFIAFGEWKRNEMEGFGPMLSAIGSCGLYLTAAGGHFAYHQLTAAAMASGFALLTVLNHGFALWRNTRLFFFIGATGGLAAMLFPLAEHDYGTALAVYVAVTLAGAIVCALRKWLILSLVGWVLSLMIIYPVIDSAYSRLAVIAALYAASLSCIFACVRSSPDEELEPRQLVGPIAIFITGLMGFWVLNQAEGALHLAILSGLGCVVALTASPTRMSKNAMLVGAVTTGALLIPCCFSIQAASVTFCSYAVIGYFVGRVALKRLMGVFAVVGFIGGAIAYSASSLSGSVSVQSGMLLMLGFAALFATLALRSAKYGWVGFAVASYWALILRWAMVLSPSQPTVEASFSMLTVASVLYALILIVLGFRKHSATLRLWSFVVMLGSVFQILLLDKDTAIGSRIIALVALGVMMLVGGYRYVRDQRAILSENRS